MSAPRWLAAAGLLLAFLRVAGAATAPATFDPAKLAPLIKLNAGQHATLDAFPVGTKRAARLRFERVAIYAADAKLFVVSAHGQREVPRSPLIFFRGYSDDGSARAALALNPDGSFAEGSVLTEDGRYLLRSRPLGSGKHSLDAQSAQLPPGFSADFRCGNEQGNLDLRAMQTALPAGAAQAAAPAAAPHALRFATVAIDTDNPFMLKLFNNSTTAAANWIASMFNTMNLMYERDVLVRLYVGTTYFQTSASDPYKAMQPSGAAPDTMSVNLDLFSAYWKAQHPAGSPTRAFAALLSGLLPSTPTSCTSSGIAWIDAYCSTGTVFGADTFGSYSVNQVCTSTNAAFGPAFSALLVAHELGHNFGAYHTHCTDKNTGAAPVGTNTVDTCVSGESYVINNVTKNCYAGPTSCPAAGAGTIMSYCNFTDSSHCASNTQDLLEFAPAHASVIDSAIAAAPGCLITTDDVFFSGFE